MPDAMLEGRELILEGLLMAFFRVSTNALLIEASSPAEAAMAAYRLFEDRTPHEFDVVGPDAELNRITLGAESQEEAITIDFGKLRESRDRQGKT